MRVDGERGPGDRSALARCVTVSRQRFAAENWGAAPLLSRAGELDAPFNDLFSVAAVDELLTERALRTPFVRMAKQGVVLPASSFTDSGGLGAEIADQVSGEKVLERMADGATLVLQGLHKTWPPIADFARRLSAELGHPCQVNAYITPAGSRGFDPHFDVHDVFVLQIHGRKHWRIHRPVHENPLKHQPWTGYRDVVAAEATGTPVIDAVFEPGDALYLPRGWIHSATAEDELSIHLTIGVPAYTRFDVVRALLDVLADDPELRGSLPLGFEPGDEDALGAVVDDVRQRLSERLRSVEQEGARRVASRLETRRADDVRAAPVAPLAALHAADALGEHDAVMVRPGLRARVSSDQSAVTIVLRGKSITLPAAATAAVTALFEGAPTRVGSLPELSTASALVVCRRLLREGVLVPAAG